MTIQEYIKNPMGKGDASLGINRSLLLEQLKGKYERLVTRKKIRVTVYYDKIRNRYLYHLIIPSETERNNTYDVVFEFLDLDHAHDAEGNIGGFDVKVFSNSPSFAYTFAYVYKKAGLLFEALSKRLGKEFVKIAPDVRNRYQIVNYEKYIFFGASYLIESKMLSRSFINSHAVSYHITSLNNVRTLETIMKEYDIEEAKIQKQKKKEKNRELQNRKKEKKEIQQIKKGIHKMEPIKTSGKKKEAKHPGKSSIRTVQHVNSRKK